MITKPKCFVNCYINEFDAIVTLVTTNYIVLDNTYFYPHPLEKWSERYPNSMRSWKQNWDTISPIFKFSATVRKVIYTTNTLESLNATYRKLNRQRSVFPSDTTLLKALYLSTFEITKI